MWYTVSMKRRISSLTIFKDEVHDFIAKRQLLLEDLNNLKKQLVENPNLGDLIRGSGGLRKARLKAIGRGKSGGFRICYFDDAAHEELFLIWIYSKSEQEDLTPKEIKELKGLIQKLKSRNKDD